MSLETERKAEAFRRWKEDLVAREPQEEIAHQSSVTVNYVKPPHLHECDREIARQVGSSRYEELLKFQMWQHELVHIDKTDVLEQQCAFNGCCSTCGAPMIGMTVRERAEHYVREEIEKMRHAQNPDSIGQ